MPSPMSVAVASVAMSSASLTFSVPATEPTHTTAAGAFALFRRAGRSGTTVVRQAEAGNERDGQRGAKQQRPDAGPARREAGAGGRGLRRRVADRHPAPPG